MGQGMIVFLLGVVFGCVVASGIWAVLWTLSKGDKRQQKDRIDSMRTISELCAEIDGMQAGGLAFRGSGTSVASLVENLKRSLTVSMPEFDVYFVKYIESLIARYEQPATTGVPRAQKAVFAAEKAEIIGEKAPTSTEKVIPGPLASLSSPAVEKDVVPQEGPAYKRPIEDLGNIIETEMNFEVTQPYKPVQEKLSREVLGKKPAEPIKSSEPVAETKIREITPEPVAPFAVAPERTVPDFSEEIQSQFKRQMEDVSKSGPEKAVDIKPLEKGPAPEDADEVSFEDLIKTQKFELQEEKAKTAKQQDEHFISGEDVIDKLDSFFGFDNK